MNRALYLAPLGLLLLLLAGFSLGLDRDPKDLPSALIGQPLPAFELSALEPGGKPLASASLAADGEPKLINIFASWCTSCRVEHGKLVQLAGEGVPIYGIDWKDEPAAGRRYLAERSNPFRAVGSDPNGRAGVDLGVTGTPETFLIDGKGIVRMRHTGPIDDQVWQEKLAPMLAQLRAEAEA
jgi:cytochrome c biogenesis protein CcmG/thiol:disulfide interchange protein DsbE